MTVETTSLDHELDRLGVEKVDVIELDVNMGVDPWLLPRLIRESGYSIRTVDEPEREMTDGAIGDCIASVGGVDLFAVPL